MNLKIGADLKDLYNELDKGGKATDNFGKRVVSTSSKLSGDLKNGAGRASSTLTDFGRIAQDAAFGPIAIANNIVPLVESFGRLKEETGSVKGALGALGSSMMGGGGLIFAFSAITAAISFASMGFDAWTRGFGSSTPKTEEHKKAVVLLTTAYDDLAKEIQKSVEASATEATKMSIIFSALSDSNTSLKDRKTLIGQLIETAPEYLRQLDKEKSTYTAIAESINSYNRNLAKSAEVKALLPGLEKYYQTLIAAQIELNKFTEGRTLDNIFGSEEENAGVLKGLQHNVEKATKEFEHAKAGLTKIAGGALSLSEILFGKTNDKGKATKEVKTISSVISDLQDEINGINKDFETGIFSDTERIKNVTTAIQKAIQELHRKPFNLSDSNQNIIELKAEINKENALINARAAVRDLVATMAREKDSRQSTTELPLNVKPTITRETMIAYQTEVAKTIQEMKTKALTQGFVGLGEELGNIITGDGGLDAAFGVLFKTLGGYLQELGAYMIGISPLIKGIKTSIQSLQPEGLLFAGIGLVALGQVLKNIPKFADGGRVPGGLTLVGERGPELVNLPTNSVVTPNHKLGQIGGLSNLEITGNIVLRGSDLYLAVKRAMAEAGRI